eukprot:TRINITY_DN11748_c1_g2_i4.p1 TRINITY_DN11748_c1_g2~~TRINITY_DN11748_c1_g2_i4.p1  ORF type:complete len:197 (+),score=9.02 TRINITY_DN11748_c1_g2_i4:335-925(+)
MYCTFFSHSSSFFICLLITSVPACLYHCLFSTYSSSSSFVFLSHHLCIASFVTFHIDIEIFLCISGDSECFSVLHDFCLLHTILFALLVGLPCLASILCSRSNDMICCVLGLGAGITHIVFGSKYVSIISSRSSYSCQLAPDAISNMVYADVLISLIGGSLFLAATLFYCIASYFNNPTFFLREIIPHHNTYRNTK